MPYPVLSLCMMNVRFCGGDNILRSTPTGDIKLDLRLDVVPFIFRVPPPWDVLLGFDNIFVVFCCWCILMEILFAFMEIDQDRFGSNEH